MCSSHLLSGGEKVIDSDYNRGRLEMAIDCEGYLTLLKVKNANYSKGYYWSPRMIVYNTNVELLEELRDISSGLGKVSCIVESRGNRKTLFGWTVHPNDLRILLPHLKLIVKENQRTLLIEALQLIKGRLYESEARLEQIHEELSRLNHRGIENFMEVGQ